jgi:hypothetical protein
MYQTDALGSLQIMPFRAINVKNNLDKTLLPETSK